MFSGILDVNAGYWGVSLEQLMENAGQAVARECRDYRRVVIFCGRGNNGGDGFVAARYLLDEGKNVSIYALSGERSKLCQRNYEAIKDKVTLIKSSGDVGESLDDFELIVDALIGVGFEGKLREPTKSLVEKINSSHAKKLSVDAPSAGRVEADITLSFHNPKIMGAKVADIGIPIEAEKYCGPGDVVYAIPKRAVKNHKGDFGRLLVLGGSRNYVGTPTLVGWGASAVGCDLVNLCVPQYVADHMQNDPHLLVTPLNSSDFLKESDVEDILNLRFDVLALGNGLDRAEQSKAALKKLLKEVDKPVVLDADALTLVEAGWLGDNMIVTPHAGEFKALFGVDVGGDNVSLVESQAKKYGCVVVLKGAVDVVSDGESTRLNKTGNPYMTKGGTGDVLAGVVAGLLAQNNDAYISACAGVFLSGVAGDFAADFYMESLTPQDMVESIPPAIKYCRDFL